MGRTINEDMQNTKKYKDEQGDDSYDFAEVEEKHNLYAE
jgi:hypothetical protein